jgi:type II secretory pathway pseudopilin PulG
LNASEVGKKKKQKQKERKKSTQMDAWTLVYILVGIHLIGGIYLLLLLNRQVSRTFAERLRDLASKRED